MQKFNFLQDILENLKWVDLQALENSQMITRIRPIKRSNETNISGRLSNVDTTDLNAQKRTEKDVAFIYLGYSRLSHFCMYL